MAQETKPWLVSIFWEQGCHTLGILGAETVYNPGMAWLYIKGVLSHGFSFY